MKPEIGKKAPPFLGPATDGNLLSLESFKGKWVILYFYPKDNTPGCTQEGNDFTEHFKAFRKRNAEVVGVSRDSVSCHASFKEKFSFPFELISDEDEKICKTYDVIKEKNMYGKKSMGVERSTFLIDPSGTLVHEWRKVRVSGHVEAVLARLNALTASA